MSKQHAFDSGLTLLENSELALVSGGYIGDGNIKDFPPWLWPYIRPTAIPSINPQQVAIKNIAVR